MKYQRSCAEFEELLAVSHPKEDLSHAEYTMLQEHLFECTHCAELQKSYRNMAIYLRTLADMQPTSSHVLQSFSTLYQKNRTTRDGQSKDFDLVSFSRSSKEVSQRSLEKGKQRGREHARNIEREHTVVTPHVPQPSTRRRVSRRSFVGGLAAGIATLAVGGSAYIWSKFNESSQRLPPPTPASQAPRGWQPAKSSLIVPRNLSFGITSFSSPDGEQLVLVEGGNLLNAGPLADSETFDPSNEMWTRTASLPYPFGRGGHTSTLLPNTGKVLIAGGYTPPPAYPLGFLDEALLYDPKTKSWMPTHAMNQRRTGHTAVLLGNERVLVVGGWAGDTGPAANLKSCEIYEYNNGNSFWRPVDDMRFGRLSPGCVVLPDGRVLVMGGYQDQEQHISLVQTEMYDPQAQPGQQWSRKADMHVGRRGFGTLWLPSINRVLVAGGVTSGTEPNNSSFTQTAELYDVEQDQWTLIKDMTYERGALDGYSNAIPLKDGTVLVVGGDAIGTSEIFVPNLSDPTASSWKSYDKSRDYIGQSIGRSVSLEDTGQVLFVTSDYSFIYTP